ncbi:beta strand repeat-containing protein, partial [Candidatus Poriferisocius sp.]|uniref:beta strand repeat-containing protein n=1 Tax=Candidatus Poriferisocius sp. TaxID=3101276 RepID=UPI003B5A3459
MPARKHVHRLGLLLSCALAVALLASTTASAQSGGDVTLTPEELYYSGPVITGADFCLNRSLGGPRTYPFDSNGDGVADVCSLSRTRRATVARQHALEALGRELPFRLGVLFAEECRKVAETYGEPEAERIDECAAPREQNATSVPAKSTAMVPSADEFWFYSGSVVTGPDFCLNRSLGGPTTYPFDSDDDGVADVCSLPRTRRAAVARQFALERLAAEQPTRTEELFAQECRAVSGTFGEPEAEAVDECAPYREVVVGPPGPGGSPDPSPRFASPQVSFTFTVSQSVDEDLPTVSGGVGDLTFSFDPALPSPITFVENGLKLSGTAPSTTAPQTRYVLTATDEDENTGTLNVDITIEGDRQPSFSVSSDSQTGIQNEPFTWELPDASGGNGTLVYTLENEADLATGLSYNATTNTISGRPTVHKTATFTLRATDRDGDVASLPLTLTITEDKAPSFSPTEVSYSFAVGRSVDQPLPRATGGDGTLTYEFARTLPANITYDGANHRLTGTPASATSQQTYRLIAEDEDGDEATLDVKITIGGNLVPSFADDDGVVSFTFVTGQQVDVVLPAFSPGNGSTTFTFSQALPNWLTHDTTDLVSQKLSVKAPSSVVAETTYKLTATVTESWVVGQQRAGVALPTATGNAPVTYALKAGSAWPAWVTWDATANTLSGTAPSTAGTSTVVVTATDFDGQSAELTVTIQVVGNVDVVFTPSSVTESWVVGQQRAGVALPTATGNAPVTYALKAGSAWPAWVTWDATANTLSGTAPSTAGTSTVVVTATDFDGQSAELTVTIQVVGNVDVVFTPSSVTESWVVGQQRAGVALPTATGNAPVTYALKAGSAWPAWVTWDATANTLSGTAPSTAGTSTVVVTATDFDGQSAELTVTIQVVGNVDVVFTPSSVTESWVVGQQRAGVALPTATGNAPVTYALKAGSAWPAWVTWDATANTLSGTAPSTAGTSTVVVTATDFDGQSAELTVTIQVVGNVDVVFTPSSVTESWVVGQQRAGVALPTATGNAPVTYALKAGSAWPAWVTWDATANTLSGTAPSTAGTSTVVVTATDFDGQSAELTVTIQVVGNVDVVFTPSSVTESWVVGQQRAGVALPTATGNAPVTYALKAGSAWPAWVTWDATANTLSGTAPSTAGTSTVVVTATDFDGQSAELTVTIQVVGNVDVVFTPSSVTESWVVGQQRAGVALPTATGNAPVTYALKAGSAWPAWVTWDATANTLSGTAPSTAGTSTVVVTATDFDGQSAELTVTIQVVGNVDVVFTPSSVTESWVVGQQRAGVALPTATGNAPVTYALKAGSAWPAWVTWDATANTLSGTAPSTAGTSTVVVTATDFDGQSAELTVTIQVVGNVDVVFTPSSVTESWVVGQQRAGVALPTATGNAPVTYALKAGSAWPAWVTWDATANTLSGTAPSTAGTSTVVVTATDFDGQSAELTVTIQVVGNVDVVFTPSSVTESWVVGQQRAGVALPTATGNAPVTYALKAGSAWPAWVTWDATANTLSGTAPSTAGTSTVVVTATDFDGQSAELTVTIQVVGNVDVVFTPSSVTESWVVGQQRAGVALPTATGNAPVTYALKAGSAWPAWVTWDATANTLSGTAPSTAGTSTVVVTATDFDGQSAELTVTIQVVGNVDVVFTPSSVTESWVVGQQRAGVALPTATGNAPVTYALKAGSAWPAWVTWDATANTLSGTAPSTAGTSTVVVTATDFDGQSAELTVTIQVVGNVDVVFTPSSVTESWVVGQQRAGVALPTATGNAPVTYALKAGSAWPAWVTWDATANTLSGTAPSTAGTSTVVVTATDFDGQSAELTVTIQVVGNVDVVFTPSSVTESWVVGQQRAGVALPTATGNAPVTYALKAGSAWPAWVTWDATANTLSGTAPSTAGTSTVVVTATDFDGQSAELTVTIQVVGNVDVVFTPSSVTESWVVGQQRAGVALPTATGNAPVTYALKAGSAWPAWVTWDATANTLSGTAPSTAGTSTVVVTATDFDGQSAELTVTIQVVGNVDVVFTPSSVTESWVVGQQRAGVALPTATGNAPVTYALKAGSAWPAWVTWDATANTLSGTAPSTAGTSTVVVTATDFDGQSAELTVTIQVVGNVDVVFTPSSVTESWVVGQQRAGVALPTATGNAPVTYALKAGSAWPAWVTWDATANTLSGTAPSTAGTSTVVVTATDFDGQSAELTVTIQVVGNVDVVFTPSSVTESWVVGQQRAGVALPTATGNAPVTYALKAGSAWPAWVTWDATANTLSGTAPSTAGTSTVVVTATDFDGQSAELTVTIQVVGNVDVVFTPSSVTESWVVGQQRAGVALPTATGNAPVTYALKAGSAWPAWVTWDATANTLSGTAPSTAGTSTVVVTATDFDGQSAELTVTIQVVGNVDVVFTPSSVTESWVVGQQRAGVALPTATGNAPVTYALKAGSAWPAWVTWDATANTLSGTAPSTAGTSTVVVTATDFDGQSAELTVTIQVVGNVDVVFTPSSVTESWVVGQQRAGVALPTATGNAPVTYALKAGSAWPAWVTWDATANTLSGTAPSTAGTSTVVVTATDFDGQSAELTVTIQVVGNVDVVFTPSSVTESWVVGQQRAGVALPTATGNAPVTYALKAGSAWPAWVTWDATANTLSGTAPSTAGTSTVVVTATDFDGQSAELTVTIQVVGNVDVVFTPSSVTESWVVGQQRAGVALPTATGNAPVTYALKAGSAWPAWVTWDATANTLSGTAPSTAGTSTVVVTATDFDGQSAELTVTIQVVGNVDVVFTPSSVTESWVVGQQRAGVALPTATGNAPVTYALKAGSAWPAWVTWDATANTLSGTAPSTAGTSTVVVTATDFDGQSAELTVTIQVVGNVDVVFTPSSVTESWVVGQQRAGVALPTATGNAPVTYALKAGSAWPAWVTWDATANTLSGTAPSTAGTSTVVVTATDFDGQSAELTVTIQVVGNVDVVFTPSSVTESWVVGQQRAGVALPTATGNAPVTYALKAGSAWPAWVTWDATANTLSGTAPSTAGTSTVVVTATDFDGQSAELTVTIQVVGNVDVVFTPSSVTESWVVGQQRAGVALPTATGNAPVTYALKAGSAWPAWVTWDATANTLSGTAPSTAGTSTVVVTATDFDGQSAELTVTIQVVGNVDVVFTPSSVTESWVVGQQRAGVALPTATGNAPVTYALKAGSAWPAWVTWDATANTLSGTAPSTAGTSTVVVTATDFDGQSAELTVTIQVVGNVDVVFTPSSVTESWVVGQQRAGVALPTATGNAPVTYALKAGSAWPAWVTWDATANTLSGTAPSTAGTSTVVVTATDFDGQSAELTVTIQVVGNVDVVFTPSSVTESWVVGQQRAGVALPTATGNAPVTYALKAGSAWPAWVTWDATANTLSGTAPSTAGTSTVVVTATDFDGQSAELTVTIQVVGNVDVVFTPSSVTESWVVGQQRAGVALPTATGNAPVTYALKAGSAWPAWVTWDATANTLSGTAPSTAGTSTVVVTATDFDGQSAELTVTIQVVGNVDVVFTPSSVTESWVVGQQRAGVALPTATGNAPVTYALKAGSAWPAWVTWDATANTLSGTAPSTAGTSTVVVTATDFDGQSAELTVTIQVVGNVDVVFTPSSVTESWVVGQQRAGVALPTATGNAPVTYALKAGSAWPAWVTWDATANTLSGTAPST